MKYRFMMVVEQGQDGYLISEVIGLPGCRSQAKTQDELVKRTKEAIALYLEEKKPKDIASFVGIQQIEIEA